MSVVFALMLLLAAVGVLLAGLALRWRKIVRREPRILLTGGGTGGHVNPALAIAEGIKGREPDARFLYVGVPGRAEEVIVRKAGYPLKLVSSQGFPGFRPSLLLAGFVVRLSWGVVRSMGILMGFAPRWVIATGGYVSAPIVLAAVMLRSLRLAPVCIFIHEQNSVPGQMNAVLGRWADRVFLTFPQSLAHFPENGVVVGYPVRHAITVKSREEALAALPFAIPEGRRVIFVFGGSQGARTINRALVDALKDFMAHRERLFIIHGMGLGGSEDYEPRRDTEERLNALFSEGDKRLLDTFYYRQDYFHNIGDVYAVSDLIVCRSGAGSLNEISRLGKPALLIPKANLPGDHQVMNARAMKQAGAAEVLFEDTVVEGGKVLEKLEGPLLARRVLELLDDPGRLAEMGNKSRGFFRRQADARILSELYQDHSYDNGLGPEPVNLSPLLSNQRLLRLLEQEYQKNPGAYDPLTAVGDADDLVYYRHRAAALLTRGSWQERNLGVKLVGLTRDRQKAPALCHMLRDRTPVSPLKRLLGGDFEQVGFIRRNIVTAFRVMGEFGPAVEEAVLQALEDPYYEVRAEACRTAAHFGTRLAGKEQWLEALLQRFQDDCFEVAMEAVKAVGEIGTDGRALEALLELHENFFWQIRDAALIAIRRLLERRVIPPSQEILDRVDRFNLTAPDFRPTFSIREHYGAIRQVCDEANRGRRAPREMSLGSF
jgi:UDP-N-acetylglucosamine--N-acetylmuramyl-(pentapeptide) pyrophosphoryl-undecaprenol N-acetylglucosamine transferase